MKLIKLYTGRDAMDAHHVRAILEGEGIPCTVMGEGLSSARGELPMTAETLPAVWIQEDDADHGLRVVREFLATPSHEDPGVAALDWTCPHCGELVEGQFAQCWSCQWERPE
jgi:hypothetical protein